MKRKWHRLLAGFHRLPYRHKLLLSIVALALLPLMLLSAFYVHAYAKAKLNDILQSESARIGVEAEKLDKMFYSALQKSVYITHNLQVSSLLKQNYEEDLVAFVDNLANVQDAMEALKSDDLQSDILIYGYNPSLYRTEVLRKINDLDTDIRDLVISKGEDYPVRRFVRSENDGMIRVHLYNKIMDFNNALAITEIAYPIEEPLRELRESLPSGSFLIYETLEESYWAVGRSGAGAVEADRAAGEFVEGGTARGYYAVTIPVKSAQDRLVLFVSKSSVYLRVAGMLAIPLLMLAGLLLTIYVSIQVVSSMLTKRLAELMASIRGQLNSLESFGRAEPEEPSDELGQLDRTFRDMVVQIRNNYRQLADQEIERRLLETELLQVNINPHVLYNTLSAIKWVHPEDEKMERLIDDMVTFYRLLLNRGDLAAPLAHELEMVTKYMDIHKFSYEANFTYEVQLDDRIRETPILRNMLQPIVENGIVHGISLLPQDGKIRISAYLEGEEVVVEVADNGQGIEAEALERLREGHFARHAGNSGGSGYALANIANRMKLYYGEDYGLSVESVLSRGTKVTLRIPCGELNAS